MNYFFCGTCIGAVLALPTGPAAFGIIKRSTTVTLKQSLKAVSACVVADLIWNISLVILGSNSNKIVYLIINNKESIRMFFGPVLIFLGLYILRSMILVKESHLGVKGIFFIALFNPLTAISMISLLMFFVGKDYFEMHVTNQVFVILGIIFGELTIWILELLIFRYFSSTHSLPERSIPIFFSLLFIITGCYFVYNAIV